MLFATVYRGQCLLILPRIELSMTALLMEQLKVFLEMEKVLVYDALPIT